MKKILSHDPGTGITTWFHGDDMTGDFALEKRFDVEPILEANKDAYNNAPQRFGELSRVACIPIVIYYDLIRKGHAKDDEYMLNWLNDPDNRFFRTRPGRL